MLLVPDPGVEGELRRGVEQVSPPTLTGQSVMHAQDRGPQSPPRLDDVRLTERDALHALVHEGV